MALPLRRSSSRPARRVLVLALAACLALCTARALVFAQFRPAQQTRVPNVARAAGSSAKFDMDLETDELEEKTYKYPSQIEGLSPEELKERENKALGLWRSLYPDIEAELDRYQTFRLDKFDKFMKADSRGQELFKLYKPGTPEYTEFFEKYMGPDIFDLASGKMKESLSIVGIIVVLVAIVAFIFANSGSAVVQGITAPFTGFAQDFLQLYGF
mmetsp:Transcript_59377/g.141557  ORF Transcript_59377/g.141557 Transcript_59377/m.141557 type:complete len:214 (-) Transcript_59377:97-738(-)|eukprot:CAMPEP_0178404762 /NCGR_PEP_ID=MMETSP0689_2-20121128/18055_1 /TAXON_ID=160604 /ORGANISM="Amphidinium massartii, Strain CS-259" /LENGTH=213 /DNA_ID=CAMNT_0020025765 /DNA_START=59 /DNA_END=700 /DNA_ORIENTATION=-